MEKGGFDGFLKTVCVLAVISTLILGGCRKKPTPPDSQSVRQTHFQTGSGVVTCKLEKVKLENVELPKNLPYFVHNMQRNNKDTLLQGELTIEGQKYVVLMGLDDLCGQMALYDKEAKQNPYWWGADEIKGVRKFNGKYYEFAVLENNSKFAARPYVGETGILKLGKGDRQLEKAEFSGSVDSKEVRAAIGDLDGANWPTPVSEYVIPVGDYRPTIMDVKYDNLSISISHNYHRDLQGRQMGQREAIYGFKVRKDKPCVLDFSNKPVVIFDTPAPDKNRFKAGDEVKFAAVLVDAELDMMIRGLRDTSVEIEKEQTAPDGTKLTYKDQKSLDPKVVIAHADGQVVAEGVMPFG